MFALTISFCIFRFILLFVSQFLTTRYEQKDLL